MSSTIKFEPYNYYHIYNKAVLNNRLFITDENYQYFIYQFFKYMKNDLDYFIEFHNEKRLTKKG